jgi:excisionase family DNA binding protein
MIVATSSPEGDGRFLSVREAAEILDVSPMDVYRLVSDGQLEAIRAGRAYRIPEEALRRYTDERE